jgi:hypothetical protein
MSVPLKLKNHRMSSLPNLSHKERNFSHFAAHRTQHVARRTPHLIFNVEIATSAKIRVIIQNRTMIFGSATPFNSKW